MVTAFTVGISSAGVAIAARGIYKMMRYAVDERVFARIMDSATRQSITGFDMKMSKKEASLILNVKTSSPPNFIKESHRKLMSLNHPDVGGSLYIATKINEAKDKLLKDKSSSENET